MKTWLSKNIWNGQICIFEDKKWILKTKTKTYKIYIKQIRNKDWKWLANQNDSLSAYLPNHQCHSVAATSLTSHPPSMPITENSCSKTDGEIPILPTKYLICLLKQKSQ